MQRLRYGVLCIGLLPACQPGTPTPAAAPAPGVAAPPRVAAPPLALAEPSKEPTATESVRSQSMHQFDEDVAFLKTHDPDIKVLESANGGRIAVSGAYQARVMTSAVARDGASLGFVNRSFIAAGKTGTAFDNYGGEDRFWLGPEGGQFALYFAPGKPFEFQNWQTPHAFQEGTWQEKESSKGSITFTRALSVQNYARALLELTVTRKLTVFAAEEAKAALRLDLPAAVKWVGYSSENTIVNRGKQAWAETTGLPSIWILGMYSPAPDTRIILPFEKQGSGDIVNDRYFGRVPSDRLRVLADQGFLVFKADGQARGKIGLSPARAKSVLGSYSVASQLLTIVRFNKPAGAKKYVNNLWELSKEPFGGDVVNAYNDGPVEPGKPSLGGFYELESSSPAAALAPGASLTHTHETYHFQGPREALDAIAQKVLGVSLAQVQAAPL